PGAKIVIAAGRSQGLEPADLIGAIVDHSGLDGEDVRNVRVLDRFSLAEVPVDRADEVIRQVAGRQVRGVSLRVEAAGR
ncbi:MAG TPA: DbpA RNA binding domain-containing protein, partial [Thermoleophilaceae bacterium]|nr:DbpA RNA binding domain-containing protein [Thermoleophilaceae bacterium]